MISKKFVSLFQQSKLSLFSSRKYFFSNINREHGHEKPLEGHTSLFLTDKEHQYEVSKLRNGISVLTETSGFPFHNDIGVLINVGTRDEDLRTSGSCAAIKSNFLRTKESQDGLVNLKEIMGAGSFLTVDYDQESIYYKSLCLPENTEAMLDKIIECSLQPKTFISNEQKIKDESLIRPEENADLMINEKLMETAYGLENLGLPLQGLESNSSKINNDIVSQFYLDNFVHEKIYICASGAINHQDFVKLVESKLDKIVLGIKNKPRKKAVYKGGINKNYYERDEFHAALAFESSSWSHENMVVCNVINTILGSSNSFSTGGPGKGMHSRTTKNLLNGISFVQSATCINSHFSDTGIFGLKISGDYDNRKGIIIALVEELKNLCFPIEKQELERAKNIFKSKVYLTFERQGERLEEAVKNLCSFQKLLFPHYKEMIDSVTSDQINNLMRKMLKSEPTLVLLGKGFSNIPEISDIKQYYMNNI